MTMDLKHLKICLSVLVLGALGPFPAAHTTEMTSFGVPAAQQGIEQQKQQQEKSAGLGPQRRRQTKHYKNDQTFSLLFCIQQLYPKNKESSSFFLLDFFHRHIILLPIPT